MSQFRNAVNKYLDILLRKMQLYECKILLIARIFISQLCHTGHLGSDLSRDLFISYYKSMGKCLLKLLNLQHKPDTPVSGLLNFILIRYVHLFFLLKRV